MFVLMTLWLTLIVLIACYLLARPDGWYEETFDDLLEAEKPKESPRSLSAPTAAGSLPAAKTAKSNSGMWPRDVRCKS